MLYKCANEACSTPFRKLREGKLFQVETEYFAGEGVLAARRTHPGLRDGAAPRCNEKEFALRQLPGVGQHCPGDVSIGRWPQDERI